MLTTVCLVGLSCFVVYRFLKETMDLTRPDNPYTPRKDDDGP